MKTKRSEERSMEKIGVTHPSGEFAHVDCRHNCAMVNRRICGGFTVLEVLIVVIILGIAAITAIPMMSSAGSIQVRSAANRLAADMAYAKSLAISRGQYYTVRFDGAADRYQIEDMFGAVVDHPVKKGFSYLVDMSDEGLDRVDIYSVDFDGTSSVTFDPLGSPDNTAVGTVTLEAAELSMTVSVEPVTGYISID